MEMKKSTRNRIIIIAVILILAVCVLPFPVRRNITAQGARVASNGDIIDDVTVTIKGWQLNFLFRDDLLKVTAEIKTDIGSMGEVEINGPISKMDEDIFVSSFSNYDESQNSDVGGYCWFQEEFDTLLIDEQGDGTYYAVSVDGQVAPAKILEKFETYM